MWPFPYEIPHPPWSPHPHPPQTHHGVGQGGYPLPPYPPISQPYWSSQLNSRYLIQCDKLLSQIFVYGSFGVLANLTSLTLQTTIYTVNDWTTK